MNEPDRVWLPALNERQIDSSFFLGRRDVGVSPVDELTIWMQGNVQDCVLAAIKEAAPKMIARNAPQFSYRFVFEHTAHVGPPNRRTEVRCLKEDVLSLMIEPFLKALERTLNAEELLEFKKKMAQMHIHVTPKVRAS